MSLIKKGKLSGCYSFLESLKLDLSCSMSFIVFLYLQSVYKIGACFCLHFSALLR